MNARWMLFCTLLASAGCFGSGAKEEVEPTPPPKERPVSPTAVGQLAKPDEVRVQLDLTQARSAIKMYRVEHGGFPSTLTELGLRFNFEKDLTYDPNTGVVKSKTYPRH